MTDQELSYTEIRQLRGARTRAAFAAELGVDPQTIYRWELEPGSPQARRPRGKVLARLRAFASRDTEPAAIAAPGTVAADVPMMAALQHVLDGDYREPEATFVRALADRDAIATVRVIASTGLACIELLYRADSRRALAALGPAMSADAPPFALAEAAAALAYSFPDGELFDVGRVHAHAVRAEQLARGESPVAKALAIAAEANAALMSGDDDLLSRALSRCDEIGPGWLPELAGMFVEQLRALAASRTGSIRSSNERIDRLLANPRTAIAPPIEARVCGMRALRWLEELGDPEAALALALRGRRVAEQARLPPGVHTGVTLRAEGEALFRLGRLAEAGRVFEQADAMLVEYKFPATIVLPAQLRYLMVIGDADALEVIAGRLAAIELPSMRGIAQAFAAWFSATAALVRGDATMLAAFARADRLCERWAPLARDVAIAYASTGLSAGAADARALFARAQRAVDRTPNAWSAAQLRRLEGNLLVVEGRIEEGRVTFEAAAATFAASGDRIDAALAHFGSASMQVALGEPGAKERLEHVNAELEAMGAPKPQWIVRGVEHGARMLARAERSHHRAGVPRSIEVALQRLAVTGATQAMVRRELVAIASELAESPASLDHDDDARGTWFDVGNHARLRVDRELPLDDERRTALRVIALVGGIALDAAELRAGDSPASVPRDVGDIPGMIAASPAMRRVVADIGRLASSRATVVITGESGVGKEVVARALHQRSERSTQPYVAFNCAAVPHELFEGQLFGYRKGAFTGATADQPGVIRAAGGGTLFLDEIGELPLDIQPKLLRFLDNAEVFPLGAKRAVTVDVRVIAATNRDLAAEVRKGRFREDLYYRLLVVPLMVPPLRERREDIMPLARHFARTLVDDGRAPAFAPDAVAALTEHPWPGNVRELRNVIARALAYSPRPEVLTRALLGL